MVTLKGRFLREGSASGTLFVPASLRAGKDGISDPVRETKRFEDARRRLHHYHLMLAENSRYDLGRDAAALFEAYNVILEDEELVTDCLAAIIAEEESAESAVRSVFDRAIMRFLRLPDPYLRERSVDIRDVMESLLFQLAGKERIETVPDGPLILASQAVLPSMVARLGRNIAGIATEMTFGGHVAAFAQILGIPLLCGCDGITAGMSGRMAMISSEGYLAVGSDQEE